MPTAPPTPGLPSLGGTLVSSVALLTDSSTYTAIRKVQPPEGPAFPRCRLPRCRTHSEPLSGPSSRPCHSSWLPWPLTDPCSQPRYEYKPLIDLNPLGLSDASPSRDWHALTHVGAGAGVLTHPGIHPSHVSCHSPGYYPRPTPPPNHAGLLLDLSHAFTRCAASHYL